MAEVWEGILDRMDRAVQRVRDRLMRATAALECAGVAYAVIGDCAVMEWIKQADESAIRNTRHVDILVHRDDSEAVGAALERSGFIRLTAKSGDLPACELFVERPDATARQALKIAFADEADYDCQNYATSDLREAAQVGAFRVVALEPLVRVALAVHRINDRVNVRDLIDVGLVDESWLSRFPDNLATRLEALIDDPDG